MAKRDRTMEQLRELSAAADADDAGDLLVRGLATKHSIVVQRAAEVVVRRHEAGLTHHDLRGSLADAANRLADVGQDDLDAAALAAVVRAMTKLEVESADALRRIVRLRWWRSRGGPTPISADAAMPARAEAAVALVRSGDADALPLLADLLHERPPWGVGGTSYEDFPGVRAAAARALGFVGQDAAALLLRGKLAAGPDPAADGGDLVDGECAGGILRLRPNWGKGYLEAWLGRQTAERLAAAAAPLAEADPTWAVPKLADCWPQVVADPGAAAAFLHGVALARTPEAGEFLLARLLDAPPKVAAEALAALALYRRDGGLWAKVEAAAARRGLAV